MPRQARCRLGSPGYLLPVLDNLAFEQIIKLQHRTGRIDRQFARRGIHRFLLSPLAKFAFSRISPAMASGTTTTPSSSPTTMSPGQITTPPIWTGTLIDPAVFF